jgi:hypothetical protein
MEDLQKAIRLSSKAVEAVPPDHPMRADLSNSFGTQPKGKSSSGALRQPKGPLKESGGSTHPYEDFGSSVPETAALSCTYPWESSKNTQTSLTTEEYGHHSHLTLPLHETRTENSAIDP